jgi:hypothetical protein
VSCSCSCPTTNLAPHIITGGDSRGAQAPLTLPGSPAWPCLALLLPNGRSFPCVLAISTTMPHLLSPRAGAVIVADPTAIGGIMCTCTSRAALGDAAPVSLSLLPAATAPALLASPAWGVGLGLNSQDREQLWCRAVARTAHDGAGGGGRQCDLQQPVDSSHFYVLLCGACSVNGCPRCMCVIDLSVAVDC